MNKSLTALSVITLVLMIGCTSQPKEELATGKVILAIFAHPDDESTVGPVLAKYAAEGAAVYLAVATDGRLGATPHAGIPKGDSLATVRVEEMKCAAEQLGINPPIMMGMHDQLKMGAGNRALNGQLDTIRMTVTKLFNELKPDVVITWGPSGWTGHHDHRLVGSIVSEVFASQSWSNPTELYYPELPAGSLPANAKIPLATTDMKYLSIKVAVEDKDYNKAKAAWLCHKSQYTPETVDQMHGLMKDAQKGFVYFRPFESKGAHAFFTVTSGQ